MPLSEQELQEYYEGFSNDTLWPLYHDVIAQPSYHREWWESYVTVNRRFAEAAASVAAQGAVVWVHDYQLQLVPAMLRELRQDLVIGFFNHIPFPPYGIYSQLPWRRQIIDGLLGADVIGFQRVADAGNFSRAVRRLKGYETRGPIIEVPIDTDDPEAGSHRHVTTDRRGGLVRTVLARAFPISIDADQYQDLARRPDIQARAREIREELGNPEKIMLGVDRLDYTKGIGHRLKAFGELLEEGRLDGRGRDARPGGEPQPGARRDVPTAARRDRADGRTHQRRLLHARPHRRSPTCTTVTRARRWWRCTSRPTSCS